MSLQRMVSALIVLLAMTLSTSTQSAMLADSGADGSSLESVNLGRRLLRAGCSYPGPGRTTTRMLVPSLISWTVIEFRGIPLGAVVIDSPWATNYNSFEFGPNYPRPAELMSELKQRGIRVILWATGMINVSSTDGANLGKADNYDEAYAAGYFVNRGQTYNWLKGVGSGIDFFNPAAVAWWEKQLDKIMSLGVSGWKVDYAERQLPSDVETAAGTKTQAEYGDAYYRAFYRYTISRDPEASSWRGHSMIRKILHL